MAIMGSTRGAAGAVFGTLFTAAANACKGKDGLIAAVMAEAMQAPLAAIQKRGGAKPGDKTMLDALAPAVEALQALQANKAGSLAVALATALTPPATEWRQPATWSRLPVKRDRSARAASVTRTRARSPPA